MNVFISWSGIRSKAVAELLSDWIKCVLQATRPWLSTRDIDRGAIWFSEINDQLKNTTVGIVCLTAENKDKPWILFETGALAKGLSTSRVCTFLVDLKPSDLQDPLAQFNHTIPAEDSVWELVRTLNACLGSAGLDERVLGQVFKTYWVQFDQKFKDIIKSTPQVEKPEQRSEKNLLGEILENTRFLDHKIRSLEAMIVRSAGDARRIEPRIRMNCQSPEDAVSMINEMVNTGMSDEIILNRLKSLGVPRSFISDEIRMANKKKKQILE